MSCKQKFTTSISLITLGVTFTLAFSHRAEALTFDLSYDSSVTSSANASEIESATQFVANEYSSLFSNNVTLNIDVVASTSAGLGESESSGYTGTTYSQVRNALIKNDPALASSLPTSNPISTGYFIPNAEAKALGLSPQNAFVQSGGQNYDGIFTFNPSYSYSFNETTTPPSNGYDFIGIAEHEFSEIMGRVSGVTDNGTFYASPYDLYSYTAPGTRSYNADVTGAYFSLNQGTTNLNTFNNGSNGGGSDTRDWAGNTLDAFNAFATPGVLVPLVSNTPVDIEAMNAIGWTSTQSVPFNIPGGATIPAFGSVLALGVMRKVRKLISNNH